MANYQKERITTFISPSPDDPSYYNILQAQIAIGDGGWIGKGYAQGPQSQLRFLRVRWTDFIFAVIAEETGPPSLAETPGVCNAMKIECLKLMQPRRCLGRVPPAFRLSGRSCDCGIELL